jgi:hypothetical protein
MAKIYVVNSKSQSDFNAYKVDTESKADLIVFEEKYQSQAKGDEKWFYVKSKSQADSKIYWVSSASQADIKVMFAKYESKAKWRKSHKLVGRIG